MYDEIEGSSLAKRRAEVVWMDFSGNIVRESDALSFKITHYITRPDMSLVGYICVSGWVTTIMLKRNNPRSRNYQLKISTFY